MKLKANILPTVIVVSVVMLLSIMLLISLFDMDAILFAESNRCRLQRANIESAFVLYCSHPTIRGNVELYDDMMDSKMQIDCRDWGLYEVVTIRSADNNIESTRILGWKDVVDAQTILWYKSNSGMITFAGACSVIGKVILPHQTVVYSELGPKPFDGNKISLSEISVHDNELPTPSPEILHLIDSLMEIRECNSSAVNINNSFKNQTLIVSADGVKLNGRTLRNNVVLIGNRITIERSDRLENIIIVADMVTIKNGFIGSMQIFASDSIIVEKGVKLSFPSGLYSRKYIGIDSTSIVEGYSIANNCDMHNISYLQSHGAVVRGLVYSDGIVKIQGAIYGMSILNRAVYFSANYDYYDDMFYDVTLGKDDRTAFPRWINASNVRKEVKRVD